MAPGQEANSEPPRSHLSSFGKKLTVLKNVRVTLLGLFGATCSDSAPGELCPLAPASLRPWAWEGQGRIL